jgi:hypothetical protein
MTRTGPQKYPGASLAYYYQGRYPGNAMEANVGVIHSTEGTSLPSYDGGASAPNLTALPDFLNSKLRWYQHYDIDTSARALVNAPGGVETNTANAVQVELVGTCDPAKRVSWGKLRAGVDYLYWPDAPDWALEGLADFVRWCRDSHNIKAQSTVTWKAYPGSYGKNNGVRFTGAQWNAYYGWLGHQHVPENDHGDPGDLDFARVLKFVQGTVPTTPPTQGHDMPPLRQHLTRVGPTHNVSLIPNVLTELYWTETYQDDGYFHAAGGKTVATNVTYSSVVSLRLTGIPEDGVVEIYATEEDATGQQVANGPSHMVRGRVGGGDVYESVPFNGIVGGRLVFEMVNRSGEVVTMTEAHLGSHYWPFN